MATKKNLSHNMKGWGGVGHVNDLYDPVDASDDAEDDDAVMMMMMMMMMLMMM